MVRRDLNRIIDFVRRTEIESLGDPGLITMDGTTLNIATRIQCGDIGDIAPSNAATNGLCPFQLAAKRSKIAS